MSEALTPEQNFAKKTCSGSIPKKLLTPCRRLGLSKKSKTTYEFYSSSPVTSTSPGCSGQFPEGDVANGVTQTYKNNLKKAKENLNNCGNTKRSNCKSPIKSKSKCELYNKLQ